MRAAPLPNHQPGISRAAVARIRIYFCPPDTSSGLTAYRSIPTPVGAPPNAVVCLSAHTPAPTGSLADTARPQYRPILRWAFDNTPCMYGDISLQWGPQGV